MNRSSVKHGRKRLAWLLAVLMMLSLLPASVFAQPAANGSIAFQADQMGYWENGAWIPTDVAPYIDHGRIMVPVAHASRALGADVTWDGVTKTVSVTHGDDLITLVIGSHELMKNGELLMEMETPAVIQDLGNGLGRTMLPVSRLARALEVAYEWDQESSTATFMPAIPGGPVIFDEAGTYGPDNEEAAETIDNDVIIMEDGVILQNMVITGTLTIAEEVGEGSVTLNNITVEKETYIRGGGSDSIYINGGEYANIILENTPSGGVRIVVTGADVIELVISPDAESLYIILEGEFQKISIFAADVTLETRHETRITDLIITESAVNAKIILSEGSSIEKAVIDGSGSQWEGDSGAVEKAEGQYSGSDDVHDPDDVIARFQTSSRERRRDVTPEVVIKPDTVIDISAITGITVPVTGGIPVTAVDSTDQYDGIVSWIPPHNSFQAETQYTAVITLTAKEGYTLAGVRENFFTVAGALSVTHAADSGVISAVFPETEVLETYNLTMTSSPGVGGTAEDVTAEGPYPEGSMVSIKADPNPGYQFAGWTATEGAFDNDSEATALYTMPGTDASVTANYSVNGNAVSLSLTGDLTIGMNATKTYRAAATDAADNPVQGVEIAFSLSSEDDEFLANLSSAPTATVFTDADGQAEFEVTTNEAILGHLYTLSASMDETDSSVDLSQTENLVIGVNNNIIRGGPAETNPLAIPIQITGVNATPYNSNLNQWTGAWQAPQTIYDQGEYMNDPDFWSNVGNSGASGSTWYNSSPGNGYGILLVDLQQVRSIRFISVFQMFSDGKITHIAIDGHGETGDTAPDASDAGWVELLEKSEIGAGGDGGTYGYNPTKFTVNASTRYIKIMAYNDGLYGSSSYIEIKGIKMYE